MTVDQRVQWIGLPAGAEAGGTLRLSVVVAPRMRPRWSATQPVMLPGLRAIIVVSPVTTFTR